VAGFHKIGPVLRIQGGVLTICTLLSVNFGMVTFASAEKAEDAGKRRCHLQNLTHKRNVKGKAIFFNPNQKRNFRNDGRC
jgi:hypothetical protein